MLTLTYRLYADVAAARAAEVAEARAAPLLTRVRELAEMSSWRWKTPKEAYPAVPELPLASLSSLGAPGARGAGVYGALKALVDDASFLPGGGALTFLAQHAYPVTAYRQRRRCGALLRGADLLLATAARALGLAVRVDVVFEEETYYDYSENPGLVRLAAPEYPGLFCAPDVLGDGAVMSDCAPLARCKPPRDAIAASRAPHDGPPHDGPTGDVRAARGCAQLAAVAAGMGDCEAYLSTVRAHPTIVIELPPQRAARPPLGRHA